MTECIEEWLARIGSAAAHQERVVQRLAGEINAPVPGPRGISALVTKMQKDGFRPSAAPVLRPVVAPQSSVDVLMPVPKPARPRPKANPANCQPMTPQHGHAAQNGFKQPAMKWDARCSTCAGTGEIAGLKGDRRPCPRCGDE